MTFLQEAQIPTVTDICPLCQNPMTFSKMGPQSVVYCSDADCSEHTIFEIPNDYVGTINDHNAVVWRKSYRRI